MVKAGAVRAMVDEGLTADARQFVGWVEPFAKPIAFASCGCLMGIASLYPSYT